MKQNKKKILILGLLVTITLLFSAFLGYQRHISQQDISKKLFENIKGIKFEGEKSGLFSYKPYKMITITIPSLVSENDDKNSSKNEKANRVFDREKFDIGIKDWFTRILNRKIAKKNTDRIILKYRDDVILDESY